MDFKWHEYMHIYMHIMHIYIRSFIRFNYNEKINDEGWINIRTFIFFLSQFNAQTIRVISEGDSPMKKGEKKKLKKKNHIYLSTCEVIYIQKKFNNDRRKMISLCNKERKKFDAGYNFVDRLDRKDEKTKRKENKKTKKGKNEVSERIITHSAYPNTATCKVLRQLDIKRNARAVHLKCVELRREAWISFFRFRRVTPHPAGMAATA